MVCLSTCLFCNRATPWRATEEKPDAFHLEGGRLALRSRFGEAWAPAAGRLFRGRQSYMEHLNCSAVVFAHCKRFM